MSERSTVCEVVPAIGRAAASKFWIDRSKTARLYWLRVVPHPRNLLQSCDDHYSAHNYSRTRVCISGARRVAAERQGGGLGRRIWRYGLADGVWAPRIGNSVVKGNDHRRRAVYDNVFELSHPRDGQRRRERRLNRLGTTWFSGAETGDTVHSCTCACWWATTDLGNNRAGKDLYRLLCRRSRDRSRVK